MSDQLKSVVFTAVVALVCSLLLTGAANGLKERKLRNVIVDRQKNILMSVGLIDSDQAATIARVEQLYRENIRCFAMDASGRIVSGDSSEGALPVCFFVQGDQLAAYILPLNSRGLWGRILGYVAIQNDGQTIAGFSVYSHSETPGLGGEIEQPWFQGNFVGKRIVDETGQFAAVGIVKGRVADVIAPERQANYVDGISGATLTGNFLSGGLKQTLLAYEALSRQFRSGEVSLPADS